MLERTSREARKLGFTYTHGQGAAGMECDSDQGTAHSGIETHSSRTPFVEIECANYNLISINEQNMK